MKNHVLLAADEALMLQGAPVLVMVVKMVAALDNAVGTVVDLLLAELLA